MPLAPTKKKPLEYIISRFSDYKSQSDSGSFQLKQDFSNRSPVYAIFWHHVLYGTPILDVHTHRAFLYFTKGKLLPRRKAAIPRKGHWDIHSAYSAWFQKKLLSFQKENQSITDRILDRALFQWGKHNQDFLCPL
jgi:hypothetical protein